MAYADDAALIADVQTSASRLGVAAMWSSGRSVQVTDDFLYEMYLLFRVIQALTVRYKIEYRAGTGVNRHQFPRKPAKKAGRPRFDVTDKATGESLYQVCAGTKAKDLNGHERGLDLSIQAATASDDPGADEVLQIFDAKYRTNSGDRIAHHEFSDFARWIELFKLRDTDTPGLDFGSLPEMDANCLVTNGESSTELDSECDRVCLREVMRFHPQSTHSYRP